MTPTKERRVSEERPNLDDLIDEWHEGDSDKPLHEYLGMTWYQYAAWVEKREPAPPQTKEAE